MAKPPIQTALILAVCLSAPALAARSGWAPADESEMRLLLAADGGAPIAGGVEILLKPGWYTYWRNPGEAGVPPIFDFSGSENVATVEVRYPVPERHDDGTSVSLIYRDEVVFPLVVTPSAPSKPVTLRLSARFGVCREVCIPTQAEAELALPPEAEADPLTRARLARYEPRVPKAPEPGRFDVERVTVADDSLLIDVRTPDSSYADLFAEPPAGWYLGQPEFVSRADGVSRYRLSLAGRPRAAAAQGQDFRFVAVAGGEAIEESVRID